MVGWYTRIYSIRYDTQDFDVEADGPRAIHYAA